MNKLLIVLMFLCNLVTAQQPIELCEYSVTKTYTITTNSNVTQVNVVPYTTYQVDNNTVYITYDNIGTYVITAKFINGSCYVEDKLIVKIIECALTRIWIPNSFTPNADGLNDEFGAYGININEFKLVIYDRWGLEVFYSNDLNYRWGGLLPNNTTYVSDIYTYVITYKDNDGKWNQLIGKITLII